LTFEHSVWSVLRVRALRRERDRDKYQTIATPAAMAVVVCIHRALGAHRRRAARWNRDRPTRTAGVFALSADEAWAVEANALKQLRRGQWIVHATASTAGEMIMAVPLESKRIAVLFRSRLAEFDPGLRGRVSFAQAAWLGRGAEDVLWILEGATLWMISHGRKEAVCSSQSRRT
jgi:hypothetical protein